MSTTVWVRASAAPRRRSTASSAGKGKSFETTGPHGEYTDVAHRPIGRPAYLDDEGLHLEEPPPAGSKHVCADYLFPADAIMKRVDGRYAAPAYQHSVGFKQIVVDRFKHSGRLSGIGPDAGIGNKADVMLGAWSCCRNVDPRATGCTSEGAHSRTDLKCTQCGVYFDYLDNARAKLKKSPTCAYHPREPEASRETGAPYGNACWPCCGATSYKNSKYHSDSAGRSTHYVSPEAATASWGCQKGFHTAMPQAKPAPMPDQGPLPIIGCYIIEYQTGDEGSPAGKLGANDSVNPPWNRLTWIGGFDRPVPKAAIRRTCERFGVVAAIYPSDKSTPTESSSSRLPQASSGGLTSGPNSAERKSQLESQSEIEADADSEPRGTGWYVEFASHTGAARALASLGDDAEGPRLVANGVAATRAHLPLISSRACVAVERPGFTAAQIWLPLPPSATPSSVASMLEGYTSSRISARSLVWPGLGRVGRDHSLLDSCVRCAKVAALDGPCRFHPGNFCWSYRVRQVLRPGKPHMPQLRGLGPEVSAALAAAPVSPGPSRISPTGSSASLRSSPPTIIPNLMPARSVYPSLKLRAPGLAKPRIDFRRPMPPTPLLHEFQEPAPPHVPPAKPLRLPWEWVESCSTAAIAGIGGPFAIVPLHAKSSSRKALLDSDRIGTLVSSPTRPRSPGTPWPGASSGDGSPHTPQTPSSSSPQSLKRVNSIPRRIPPFKASESFRQNTYLGIAWTTPRLVVNELPKPLVPKPKAPYPAPASFVVCDHQCVRRLYPVIRLPVKNTSEFQISVSVMQHFAECDKSLLFDRKRAYGYRLMVNAGSYFTFPPLSVTTVSLGVADPNFFSKTMMVPLSMLWKDTEHEWEGEQSLPRKRWHPRMPANAPTVGKSPANPFGDLMYPPAMPAGERGVPGPKRNKQSLWEPDFHEETTNLHRTAHDSNWARPLNHANLRSRSGLVGKVSLPLSLRNAIAAGRRRSASLVDGGPLDRLRRTYSAGSLGLAQSGLQQATDSPLHSFNSSRRAADSQASPAARPSTASPRRAQSRKADLVSPPRARVERGRSPTSRPKSARGGTRGEAGQGRSPGTGAKHADVVQSPAARVDLPDQNAQSPVDGNQAGTDAGMYVQDTVTTSPKRQAPVQTTHGVISPSLRSKRPSSARARSHDIRSQLSPPSNTATRLSAATGGPQSPPFSLDRSGASSPRSPIKLTPPSPAFPRRSPASGATATGSPGSGWRNTDEIMAAYRHATGQTDAFSTTSGGTGGTRDRATRRRRRKSLPVTRSTGRSSHTRESRPLGSPDLEFMYLKPRVDTAQAGFSPSSQRVLSTPSPRRGGNFTKSGKQARALAADAMRSPLAQRPVVVRRAGVGHSLMSP